MSRLGRLAAVMLVSSSALLLSASGALADHCPPIDNPDPIPGQNTTYCHTPKPTEEPEPTDTPEPAETPRPATAAPTVRPAPRTQAPVVRTNPNTPAPTPFDIGGVEVPDEDPLATPQIVVDGPLDDQTNFEVAEPTAGVSSWIFGFIFGFIVGGFVGRASWGLRKRRRQQIFG
jgi:hypothetical protein